MLRIDRLKLLHLGIEQEQNSKIIEIDVKPWLKEMPNAAFAIAAIRPGETEPYIGVTQLEDGILRWTITAGDLGVAGRYGKCDIRAYETEEDGSQKIRKTAVILTTVDDTLPGTTAEEPPEASQGWLDSFAQMAERAEEIVNSIKEMTAEAETLAAGSDATAEFDAETSVLSLGIPKGADGVSPTVATSKEGKITTVTITDKDGAKTFQVRDGEDGEGAGDMTKAVYDEDNDGVVDLAENAQKLGGALPSAYAAASHTHEIANITGLQTALNGKAPTSHTHEIANITGLQTALNGKAPSSHTHTIANVTGLQTALDGKALSSHTHTIANITGLQTALDGKATKALYTATLGTTWTGSAAPYTQTVNVAGILAADAPVIDLVASATAATAEAELEAWALVYRIETGAGTITAYASDAPTTAMNLQILCVR